MCYSHFWFICHWHWSRNCETLPLAWNVALRARTLPKFGQICYVNDVKRIFEIFHGTNGSWGLKIEMHTFHKVSYNILYVVREQSEGKKWPAFRRALELPCPGVAGGGAPSCPPAILGILARQKVPFGGTWALEVKGMTGMQLVDFFIRRIYVSNPQSLVNMNIEGNI